MTGRSGKYICLVLLAITAGSSAQDERPTARTPNCTTNGCHAKQQEFDFLHGPIAAGACEVCHSYADVAKHEFTFRNTGAAMCDFCHVDKTAVQGMKVHEPVAKGECLSCHSPHGGRTRAMLLGEKESDSCLVCHEDVAAKAHLHTPLVEGKCTDCHLAHTSPLDHLLIDQGRSLCMRCHEGVDKPQHAAPLPAIFTGAAGKTIALPAPRPAQDVDVPPDDIEQPAQSAEHRPVVSELMPVHAPVMEECTACHHHHASDQESLLVDTPLQLCSSCHEDIASKSKNAAFPHSVVTDDRACLNCHQPHTSPVHALLRDWPIKLCMDCHKEPVARADGSIVDPAPDLLNPHPYVHEPVVNGKCRDCHEVHGGAHQRLLVNAYRDPFYQQYDPNAYALCTECHDQRLMTEAQTDVTNFRNGERNLHYVHVTGQRNGRSCRVCHATHTAQSPRMLRKEVEFGEWTIPINFEPTLTGGSCAGGCHRARRYDRNTPVLYEQ